MPKRIRRWLPGSRFNLFQPFDVVALGSVYDFRLNLLNGLLAIKLGSR